MDPYTTGTIIRTILQSTGPKVGIAIVVLGGIIFVMFKAWSARTAAMDAEAAATRERQALHIKRDAEEDARMAAERAAQTSFLHEQVRANEERERGFVKVLAETAATMVGIREALQETMSQGTERHAKTMEKLEEIHRDMPRRVS